MFTAHFITFSSFSIMGYNKRESSPVAKATKARITGLSSISPAPKLSEGLSIDDGNKLLADHATATEAYNAILLQADAALNALKAHERKMTDWNKRTLAGVGSAYGDDSTQYEQAGGTRRSERKKRTTTPKAK